MVHELDQYIFDSGKHPIAEEFEQIEKLGTKVDSLLGRGSTFKVYDFPNGIKVSLVYFPNGFGLLISKVKYETLLYSLEGQEEIQRFETEDQVHEYLSEVLNR